MAFIDVSEISWHDAVLNAVSIVPSASGGASAAVDVFVEAYKTHESSSRMRLRLRCDNVKRAVVAVDFLSLLDNAGPGNIGNIYVKSGQSSGGEKLSTLWIYLVDGVLEVAASSVLVEVI